MANGKALTPQDELEYLIQTVEGNSSLISQLTEFTDGQFRKKEPDLREGVSRDEAIEVVVLAQLNDIIFKCLDGVALFYERPLDCVKWIKGILGSAEPEVSEFYRGLLAEAINDDRRFYRITKGINHVRAEVQKMRFDNWEGQSLRQIGVLQYFLGNGFQIEFDRFANAFLLVRGIIKNKEAEVKTFVDENREQILKLLETERRSVEPKPPRKEKVTKVIEGLGDYNFNGYLAQKGYDYDLIVGLFEKHSGKEFRGYSIALLIQTGYYRYLNQQFCQSNGTKTQQVLGRVFGTNERTIRGFYYGYDHDHNESKKYPSYLHKEQIAFELKGEN